MVRIGMVLSVVFASVVMVGGCGGGDGDGGEPLYIVGTWVGPMSHRIIDSNQGTDTTFNYTVTFYILSQEGSRVSGKMQLRDPGHVADLHGTMSGSRFKGVRAGVHTVTIEFTASGNTLTGTFRFVGDGLDEYGEYSCTKL